MTPAERAIEAADILNTHGSSLYPEERNTVDAAFEFIETLHNSDPTVFLLLAVKILSARVTDLEAQP